MSQFGALNIHFLGVVVTLRDALSILRVRWITVALLTLAATLIAVAVAFLTPPQYSASTMIFIATPQIDDPESAYAASRFSQDRAASYRDLMASESLATRTVSRLQLKESPRDLARRVHATSNPDSVVLKLSVNDPSPKDAVNLANALSDDFVRMVKDLETPTGEETPFARAVVVKSASDATWISPDRRKIIGFGVLAGLLLGGVSALLRGPRKLGTAVDDSNSNAVESGQVGDVANPALTDPNRAGETQRLANDEAQR